MLQCYSLMLASRRTAFYYVVRTLQSAIARDRWPNNLLTLDAHAQRGLRCLLSVCMSALSSRAFRRPTRGMSGYSAENCVKLNSPFL